MSIALFFMYILILHFVADFILQPYWMSLEKADNMSPLILHIIIYTAVMFFGMWAMVGFQKSLLFSLSTGALHFAVDFVTSRVISDNSRALKLDPDESKPVHRRLQLWGPITLLGFDQLLHQICLAYAVHLFFL